MSIAWGLFSYFRMTGLWVGVSVTLVATFPSYDNIRMQDRRLAKSMIFRCPSFFNQREKLSPEFLLGRFGPGCVGHMPGPRGSGAGRASFRDM